MKILKTLLTALVLLTTLAVGVLFALQNDMPVPLDLLVYTFAPRSLALWVLGALAVGGVLGMLASSGILVRLHASRRSTIRQLDKLRLEQSRQGAAGLKGSE